MKFEINKTATYTGHKDSVYDLSEGFSPNHFLSASGDGFVVHWTSPDIGVPIAKVNNPIYAIEKIGDHKIWIGENSQGIRLVSSESKKEEAFLQLPKASFFDIQSFEEKTFAVSSLGYIHVINNLTNTFIKHIEGSNKSARSIAIHKKRREFAVGFSDHKIRIYDLDSLLLKTILDAHANSVFSLIYRDNFLISSGRDAHIKVWDTELNYLLATSVPAHNYTINNIIELEGTPLLASCSMDKTIKIWNIENLQLLKVINKGKFAAHGTSVNKLLWNKEAQKLYSASDDRTISEWKIILL